MNITAHIVLVPSDEGFERFFKNRHVSLAAIPRVGEYLTNNDQNGLGQAFKVLAVLHPVDPEKLTATIELRLERVGTSNDLFAELATKVD